MADQEQLKKLCFDEKGELKSKAECRAAMINHLILDEMMDIDESEDFVDQTLKALDLWPDGDVESKPL
ncbi:MAG: hypothetical protein ACOYUZ_04395 [Patescibacteria group bacterium]